MPQRPPNVLFLMSDEHRADVAGYAGDSVVRTPVLDELARTGVVFRNAYTPSPICIPARQCLMAGQLPRTCGVEGFGSDLPPSSMTFARSFARHDYHTACFGKLHHQGEDQMQGWTMRMAGDVMVRAGHAPPGGSKWSDAKEVQRAGIGRSHWQSMDMLASDAADMFCRDQYFGDPFYDRARGDEPLLLKLSLVQPHYPYLTDEDKFTYYLNRVRPRLDEPVLGHPFLSTRQVRPGIDASRRELRRATAAYYGMIEDCDHRYGRLMRTLEHLGQDLDDWIILYTSDHGEMLGEHGIWEKQKFFEASARVPLIIRPPRRDRERWGCEGRTVHENVNLCDLFATLCHLAGLPLPDAEQTVRDRGLDSRSLVGLLDGSARAGAGWDNETISQFKGTDLMIKRDALKYQWYGRDDCRAPEHREVLFDLDADPAERANLIGEARYANALAAFRQRRGKLGFGPDADPHYANAGYAKR